MAAPRRERVQAAFLAGELEVIVATIAFGMGIDKADVRTVVHTALPSTRRGLLPGDRPRRPRREALARRPPVLVGRPPHARVLPRARLPRAGGPRARCSARSRPSRARSPSCPGAPASTPRRSRARSTSSGSTAGRWWRATRPAAGRAGWRPSYVRQREHKKEQLDEMLRFAESHGCRMLHLLRHFGDQEDRTRPCGGCDACAPGETVVRRWRPPTRPEAAAAPPGARGAAAARPAGHRAAPPRGGRCRSRAARVRGAPGRAGAGRSRPAEPGHLREGRPDDHVPAGGPHAGGALRGPGGDRGGPAGGSGAGRGSSPQARAPEARAQAPACGGAVPPRPETGPGAALPPSWSRSSGPGGSRRPGGAACPPSASSPTARSSPSPRHARAAKTP